ncbi:MAG TPA: hypothetical protein VMZ92_03950 [Planctomycetota bacterium]|nr:hypothetical protein [Planctomycetota bacterium]
MSPRRPHRDINEPLLSSPPTRPFRQEVLLAFLYPLQLRGILVVAACTLLMIFGAALLEASWEDLLEFHLRSVRLVIPGLVLITFLVYCFFDVIQSSAGGRPAFPKILFNPEFDWLESYLYGIEGVVISYLPTLGFLLVTAGTTSGVNTVLLAVFRALGCLYLPMALLSLAVWRDFAAISPEIVFPLMRKVPGPTALAAALLWIATEVHVRSVAVMLGGVYVGVYAVGAGHVVAVYLYFVTARIIGITHWTYRNEIDWFPDVRPRPKEE